MLRSWQLGTHLLPESSVTTLGSLKFLRNLSSTDLEALDIPNVTPSLHLISVHGRTVVCSHFDVPSTSVNENVHIR